MSVSNIYYSYCWVNDQTEHVWGTWCSSSVCFDLYLPSCLLSSWTRNSAIEIFITVFVYKKQLLCVVGILTMVSISRSAEYTWCKIEPAIQFQSGDSQSGILHCSIWPWLKAKWVKYYWEEILQNCLLCTVYGLHPLVICLKTISAEIVWSACICNICASRFPCSETAREWQSVSFSLFICERVILPSVE